LGSGLLRRQLGQLLGIIVGSHQLPLQSSQSLQPLGPDRLPIAANTNLRKLPQARVVAIDDKLVAILLLVLSTSHHHHYHHHHPERVLT
jgi:hypothetical protein